LIGFASDARPVRRSCCLRATVEQSAVRCGGVGIFLPQLPTRIHCPRERREHRRRRSGLLFPLQLRPLCRSCLCLGIISSKRCAPDGSPVLIRLPTGPRAGTARRGARGSRKDSPPSPLPLRRSCLRASVELSAVRLRARVLSCAGFRPVLLRPERRDLTQRSGLLRLPQLPRCAAHASASVLSAVSAVPCSGIFPVQAPTVNGRPNGAGAGAKAAVWTGLRAAASCVTSPVCPQAGGREVSAAHRCWSSLGASSLLAR
jgi:hypothetical protein